MYDFVYDAAQRLSSRDTEQFNGAGTKVFDELKTFTYDEAGQIATVTTTLDGGSPATENYDGHGSTSTQYDVGADNRLNEDDYYTYTYDDEGRLTERTPKATAPPAGDPPIDQVHQQYDWDHIGRLIGVDILDSDGDLESSVRYGYNALGRKMGRIAKNSAGNVVSETGYVYDGLSVVAEVDLETDKVTKTYFLGTGPNEVIAIDEVYEDAASTTEVNTVWTFTDPLGTVRSVGSIDTSDNTWSIIHRAFSTFGLEGAATGGHHHRASASLSKHLGRSSDRSTDGTGRRESKVVRRSHRTVHHHRPTRLCSW